MDYNAEKAYAHTGTYYFGLTQGIKYDDEWKYPKNKICCVVAKNAYSALFMLIGI